MIRSHFLAFFAFVFLVPTAAGAQVRATPFTEFREARVRLLGERDAQGRFEGGLEIRLAEGFKTYWKQAGDSGVPPLFDFSKSEGVSGAQVRFPFPLAFDDGAGGMAFGYKHGVILPVSATVTPQARVHLKLDFAVCGTLCIPLNAELVLDVTSAAKAEPEAAAALAATRAALPRRVESADASVKRLAAPGEFLLKLPYAGDVATLAAFADAPGFFEVKGVRAAGDGMAEITLAGQPAPGGTALGPLTLTYGTPALSFERTIALDAAKP